MATLIYKHALFLGFSVRSKTHVVAKIHDENTQWVTTTGGNIQHLLYTVYGFNLNCVHF